jgi:hypothetical protein
MHTRRWGERLSAPTRSATDRRPSRRRKKPRKNEAQTNDKKYSVGGCYRSTLKVGGCKIVQSVIGNQRGSPVALASLCLGSSFSSFLRLTVTLALTSLRNLFVIRDALRSNADTHSPSVHFQYKERLRQSRGINFVRDLWNRSSFPRDWLHKEIDT